MRLFELNNVAYSYGRGAVQVFNGLSISAERGRSVALIGPSGSGKSTALGLLGLLLEPTEGTVLFDGQKVRPADRHRLQIQDTSIAWILQTSTTLPMRTCLDNVALAGLASGMSRSQCYLRARTALRAVGMLEYEHRSARSLSGGQIQRVGIARAILSDASLVLADEPTAQLDSQSKLAVIDCLGALVKSGSALVVSTHDDLVASRCDEVYAMD